MNLIKQQYRTGRRLGKTNAEMLAQAHEIENLFIGRVKSFLRVRQNPINRTEVKESIKGIRYSRVLIDYILTKV